MSAPRTARPGRKATVLACSYVGLITAVSLARGIAGAHGDATQAVLFFLAFPGSLLVTAFVVLPVGALLDGGASEAANPYGPMVYLAGGAAVNVFLVHTAARVLRRFRAARRAG
ncbi:hypothetical protein LG634_03005 [Streptomyces bambusae]|uniref:hypothetical protein n=1 Tax=Streptomyces bambusae TaxID=1550616 RepID=UPI001CFE31A3|nr:hypothetical protein [Streptomyces bambusae]MCB5163812.1 hypothetical protein [Streptomyces bambusae]